MHQIHLMFQIQPVAIDDCVVSSPANCQGREPLGAVGQPFARLRQHTSLILHCLSSLGIRIIV